MSFMLKSTLLIHTHTHIQRERDVGIICVIIYDDLALEAWTQREREREMDRELTPVSLMIFWSLIEGFSL